MRTKHADPRRVPGHTGPDSPGAQVVLGSVVYWLEDDLGRRVSKRFSQTDQLLVLAGRALENLGTLDGWTLASRDTDGPRRILASGADLAHLATPFMPARAPSEAAVMARLREALCADRVDARRALAVTDETVYQA